MTVGQESSAHEMLILPHLTMDIILGVDILSKKFQIISSSNTLFLNGRDVLFKESQPLLYSHIPEEIVETIPSESFTRNEQRDTTYRTEKTGTARDLPSHIRLNSVICSWSWDQHGGPYRFETQIGDPSRRIEEDTKMVNHSFQTFEDPFEKNGYFQWKEVVSQKVGVPMEYITESIIDMLRPAAAKHLPVSLMPESIR
ncbi:hypothetical protein JTB14_007513 [Gonioctena quinquepunctata]|nr:hypothetical protein JTB14_007513 [Gonioctena quinquepunctata]